MQIRLIQGWLPWLMGLPEIVSLNYLVVVRPTELDSDWTASTVRQSEDEDRTRVTARDGSGERVAARLPRPPASGGIVRLPRSGYTTCLTALVNDTTVAITHLNTWARGLIRIA